MSWRKYDSHKEETKAVKEALRQAGYKVVKVGHGKGTAWGWLKVTVQVDKPADCYCEKVEGGNCSFCHTVWSENYRNLLNILASITGRHGDCSGNISIDIVVKSE